MEYFSHDINARNSEKVTKLRMRMGAEGYGMYFMLLELLAAKESHILMRDYESIAFGLQMTREEDLVKVKRVVEEFGLFEMSEDTFWSQGMLERTKLWDKTREELREKRTAAGKASGEARRKKKEAAADERQSDASEDGTVEAENGGENEQKTNMCSTSVQHVMNKNELKEKKRNKNNNTPLLSSGSGEGERFFLSDEENKNFDDSDDEKTDENELAVWVHNLADADEEQKGEIERLTDGFDKTSAGGEYMMGIMRDYPGKWQFAIESLHTAENEGRLRAKVPFEEWHIDEAIERSNLPKWYKTRIIHMLGAKDSEVRGVCAEGMRVIANPKSGIVSPGNYLMKKLKEAIA